ncbi:unnamed protein product [Linum trigynum]
MTTIRGLIVWGGITVPTPNPSGRSSTTTMAAPPSPPSTGRPRPSSEPSSLFLSTPPHTLPYRHSDCVRNRFVSRGASPDDSMGRGSSGKRSKLESSTTGKKITSWNEVS